MHDLKTIVHDYYFATAIFCNLTSFFLRKKMWISHIDKSILLHCLLIVWNWIDEGCVYIYPIYI